MRIRDWSSDVCSSDLSGSPSRAGDRMIGRTSAVIMTDRSGEAFAIQGEMDCEFEAGTNLSGDGPAEAELDHSLDHLAEIDRDQRYFERYGTEHRPASPMAQDELDAPLLFELGHTQTIPPN